MTNLVLTIFIKDLILIHLKDKKKNNLGISSIFKLKELLLLLL